MEQTKFKRVVIYTSDVQHITGKSERTARLILQKIRKHYSKHHDQYVSIREFCQYTGLKEEEVEKFLRG